MSKEEIAEKLDEFQDYLSISNIFTDIIRWISWTFVTGLAWIVDKLENLTDDILLIKQFYKNDEITLFIDSIRPLLYILFAFSILYAGYMLIFQKKFNREGMVINLFIALTILALLGIGIDKGNEFTDEAIDAIKTETLFPNDETTLSGSIIKRNVIDLVEFDQNKWQKKDIDVTNNISPSKILNINVKEKYNKDLDGISGEGKNISKYSLSFNNNGDYTPKKMDQSGLEWNNEYFFRYSINWFTIIVTLAVISFTLFSIALKLAKLFFELTFNYILALIIAPVDIHDGQKTKKVLQAIMNTFIATILIFLSMKVYMIGTAYLETTLSTFPYLIALIAFSLAVIDGPNIVERLFGIDAGMKSGWGVLAGAYAGSRVVGSAAKSIGSKTNGEMDKVKKRNSGNEGNKKNLANKSNKKSNNKAPSPNENDKNNSETKNKNSMGKGKNSNTEGMEGKKTDTQDKDNKTKSEKVPSPNDSEESKVESTSTNTSGGSANKGGSQKSSIPKPTSANDIAGGKDSNETNKNKAQQKSTVQNDTEIDHVVDEVEGKQNVNTKTTGGSSGKVDVKPTNSNNSNSSRRSGGTNSTEKTKETHNSTVKQDIDVENQGDHVRGNVNNTERVTKRNRSKGSMRPQQYKIPNKKKLDKLRKNE